MEVVDWCLDHAIPATNSDCTRSIRAHESITFNLFNPDLQKQRIDFFEGHTWSSDPIRSGACKQAAIEGIRALWQLVCLFFVLQAGSHNAEILSSGGSHCPWQAILLKLTCRVLCWRSYGQYFQHERCSHQMSSCWIYLFMVRFVSFHFSGLGVHLKIFLLQTSKHLQPSWVSSFDPMKLYLEACCQSEEPDKLNYLTGLECNGFSRRACRYTAHESHEYRSVDLRNFGCFWVMDDQFGVKLTFFRWTTILWWWFRGHPPCLGFLCFE